MTAIRDHAHDCRMSNRVVLVDPYEHRELADLADLSGSPWVRVRAWPFSIADGDRVVTTIPVPAGAAARALGVLTAPPQAPQIGELWPVTTVDLDRDRAEIVAHMGGANEAPRTRVGVFGLRGGLGVTHLSACIARILAHHPLMVAMVSDDPHSPLPEWTKTEDSWPTIDVDGPLMPERLRALAPSWQRVSLIAGRCPSPHAARRVAAALARCHDVVVEDRGRIARATDLAELDAAVVVFSGDRSDLHAWDAISDAVPCDVIPVARAHNTGTVCAPADIADFLGATVVTFGHEKSARIAPKHGGEPGDCSRGSGIAAASEIVAQLTERM